MDFCKRHENIKRSYIVCSTGRSGSTLLCKTLAKLKFFGNPEEFFHHNILSQLQLQENPKGFMPYFESVLDQGLSHNGVFAIKMHWWQLYDFLKIARQIDEFKDMTDIEILNAAFPNLKLIYIRRQDMISQAVSTEIALQTGVWVSGTDRSSNGSHIQRPKSENAKPNARERKASVKFRPLRIYKWEQRFKDQNGRWKQFFTAYQLEHYELTYEQLTNNFEQEVANVVQFLDLESETDLATFKKPTKRQSNRVNEEFTTCYKALPPLLLRGINKLNVLFA